LCERLGVSNAARTLHGGLLDAELLADVYINLTRGQNALLMDGEELSANSKTAVRQDYSHFKLPVINATADELIRHEKLLDDIDKASNGKTVWRQAADQSTA
jgi:DNA polymerase-3 subunit epsilon